MKTLRTRMSKASEKSSSELLDRACQPICEQLEGRRLLSTITWVNRTSTTEPFADRFGTVFGSLANQARAVVDAALAAWARTITDFNYGDGTNNYNVLIQMNASPSAGIGANASATGSINGKPSQGTMGIGWQSGTTPSGNVAAGWWLDPTPNESSEFQGTTFNAFARNPTAALGGFDLFTVVLHEMGHAIGLASTTQTRAVATKSATNDTFNPATTPASKLWTYNNNGALWTEFDSGGVTGGPANFNGPQHFADLGQSTVVSGVTRSGAVALMNATGGNNRAMISDIEADCARWAYNYTIATPSAFGTMYDTLDADGTLRINTTSLNAGAAFANASNDVIDIRPVGGNLQVTVNPSNHRAGIDPLSPIVSNFPMASVSRITVNTGDGNDFVRVFSNPNNIPMTLTGGDGTDTIEAHGAGGGYDNFRVDWVSLDATNLDVTTDGFFEAARLWGEGGDADITVFSLWDGPVEYIGAATAESVNLRQLTTGSPMVMFMAGGNDTVNVQVGNGVGLIESNVTINGSDGDDMVNVAPVNNGFTTLTHAVTFNGDNDNDTFVLGSNNADTIAANLVFNGGGTPGGNGNRIIYNDQGVLFGVNYDVAPTIITRTGFSTPRTVSYSGVDRIIINGGFVSDNVIVRNGVNPIVEAYGNDGDDFFTRGDGILQAQSGAAFNGGNGNDRITFDDHLNTNNIIWDCKPNQVIYGGIVIQNTTLFESVGILAGPGQNQITFGLTLAQNFDVDAGPGNDSIIIGFQAAANFQGQVSVQGSDGNDTFTINSSSTSGGGYVTLNGGNNLNSISVNRGDTLYHTITNSSMVLESLGTTLQLSYFNMSSGSATGSSLNDVFLVYGASSLFGLFQLFGNDGDDDFQLYPSNDGNFSFQNLQCNGGQGTDRFLYYAVNNTGAGDYTFQNNTLVVYRGGITSDTIQVGSAIENVTLQGGTGNDVIRVNQYNAGTNLRIEGGSGDDTAILGNGNFAANITSIASLVFDGQAGTNDELRIDNASAAAAWTYTCNNTFIALSGTSYSIGIDDANAERLVVNAGAGNDIFSVRGVPAGSRLVVNAGGGYDDMTVGSPIVAGVYSVSSILGPVEYHAGAGNGRARVYNNFGTGTRTTHIAADSIGAFPGDTLFEPGGSFHFDGLADNGGAAGLELALGRGDDSLFVQPLAGTSVFVSGGTQAAADTLNLALADAQGYQITGTAASGSVTSSNLKPVTYQAFENGPILDAAAPAVANVNFDLAPPGARGTSPNVLKVQFTEDVGAFMNGGVLELINSTRDVTIPSSDIFMTYDAATFTATFTFDNYPGGLLPDGAYVARILSGLTDTFGNPMPASGYSAFIWSAGTAGNDVYRVTRISGNQSFAVYLNNDTAPTFASSGTETIKIFLTGAAGDDSLTLDATIGSPMPSKGTVFDGGADNDTVHVVGSAAADNVTMGTINVNLNSGTETHREVEAFTYDGNGDYDTLRVKSGTPTTLLGTQRFADLILNDGATVFNQSGSNSTIVTRHLTLGASSVLDLADNDMLIVPVVGSGNANTIAQIQTLINGARNGGAWNGFGITSTAAQSANPRNTTLGAMFDAEYQSVYGAGATFNGEAISNGAILVKYTYYGDVEFNGIVDFDDYSRIDAGFNGNKSGWLNGDVDGNGVVDFDDYSLIDQAFNTQGSTL